VHRTLERSAEIQTALVAALEDDVSLGSLSTHQEDMQAGAS
jgi:hypothetical protein